MPRLSRLFPRPPWRQTFRCCGGRGFRSKAALDALAKASAESLVLYNYPSFAGAFGSLFARLYHSHLRRPLLILPFSAVHPFRFANWLLLLCSLVSCSLFFLFVFLFYQLAHFSFMLDRVSRSYFLRVVVIDHHKSALLKVDPGEGCPRNLHLHLDTNKSSAVAAYDYFTQQLNTENSAEGVRADGNSNLADEIGKELSIRSAAAGLRPIGAVVYMQRGILKMCLRSTDSKTDTSEIAKAYGGGGNSFSSSFAIKMDEYNKWVS
ncbi:hypothetical protein EJ110_NYTH02970 [Nymphaea thermarum]|nr:hypothetical protein EJ110_NYTH02970 [Nymphaea thermarum]